MWDERFAGEDYMFGKEPAQALTRHKGHLHKAGTTLAVADGEGRNSIYLAKQGFAVHAMDSSIVGIEKAQKLALDHEVAPTFELADIYDYDWHKQSYDNVVAIFIQFAPPEKWDSLFAGLKSALRPGGCLFLHGYTPKQVDYGTGGPSNPAHLYTTAMLDDAFADMDILVNEAYEAVLDEGPGHSGQSALIDFIAIKK
jgi:cyclopropane fatty-acyl-phospholipid synthase-like methyltransferase